MNSYSICLTLIIFLVAAKFSIAKKPTGFCNHAHEAHPKSCSIPNTAKCTNIKWLPNKSLKTLFV